MRELYRARFRRCMAVIGGDGEEARAAVARAGRALRRAAPRAHRRRARRDPRAAQRGPPEAGRHARDPARPRSRGGAAAGVSGGSSSQPHHRTARNGYRPRRGGEPSSLEGQMSATQDPIRRTTVGRRGPVRPEGRLLDALRRGLHRRADPRRAVSHHRPLDQPDPRLRGLPARRHRVLHVLRGRPDRSDARQEGARDPRHRPRDRRPDRLRARRSFATSGGSRPAIVICLGYLWMLWDPEKQTWHDKMAGSVVVPVANYPVS